MISIGDGEKMFTRTVSLLVIEAEVEIPYILIGRNLMNEYKMKLEGTNKLWIDDILVFERNPRLNDSTEDALYYVVPEERWNDWNGLNDWNDDTYTDTILCVDEDTTLCTHCHELLRPSDSRELTIKFHKEPSAPFGRPHLVIPWLSEARPRLNFGSTYARDQKTLSRLTAEEKRLYDDAIKQLMEGGYATPIPDQNQKVGHYIGIRPVFDTKRKSTKCRLCLDATELNKFTFPGPQRGTTNIQILLQFRCAPYCATFDLQKAFWQVKIYDDDHKYFSTIVAGNFLQFTRLIFGANFSPAALQTALGMIHSFIKLHDSTVNTGEPTRPSILEDDVMWTHYVDDFLVWAEDKETLITKVQWSRWFLQQYGFPSDKVEFSDGNQEETKFLGYRWNPGTDRITVKLPEWGSNKGMKLSKKFVLGETMKLYDPLGVFLRLQIAGRCLVRDMCKDDVNVTEITERLNRWRDYTTRQLTLAQGKIPRHVKGEKLVIICDASTVAWAAISYVMDSEEQFHFLFARGGLVRPTWTIPRAELHALVEAVQMLSRLPLEKLKVSKIIIMTDNEPNVSRLRNVGNDRFLKTFELTRVEGIRAAVHRYTALMQIPISVRTVPGVLNPADAPTRPWPLEWEDFDHWHELAREFHRPEVWEYTGNETLKLHTDIVHYMNLRSNQTQITKNPNNDQETTNPEKISETQKITITDPEKRREIIHTNHLPHHYGITTTYRLIRRTHQWKGMHNDVTKFVKRCEVCSEVRVSRTLQAALGHYPKWENTVNTLGIGSVLGVDVCVMSDLPEYTGFLTITCAVSKWIRVLPLPTQRADDICHPLEELLLSTLIPRVVISDGAASFKGKTFTMFCRKWAITHLVFPPHAPTYHGWVERPHKQILDQLRLLQVEFPSRSWVELLPLAQYLVNTRPYDPDDPVGLCPLHLVFNGSLNHDDREATLEVLRFSGLDHMVYEPKDAYAKRGEKLRRKQEELTNRYLKIFRDRRTFTQEKLKKQLKRNSAQQPQFPVGSMVKVYRPKTSKIACTYTGPFEVIDVPSAATRRVKRADGRTTLEYVVNLIPINPPEAESLRA